MMTAEFYKSKVLMFFCTVGNPVSIHFDRFIPAMKHNCPFSPETSIRIPKKNNILRRYMKFMQGTYSLIDPY